MAGPLAQGGDLRHQRMRSHQRSLHILRALGENYLLKPMGALTGSNLHPCGLASNRIDMSGMWV